MTTIPWDMSPEWVKAVLATKTQAYTNTQHVLPAESTMSQSNCIQPQHRQLSSLYHTTCAYSKSCCTKLWPSVYHKSAAHNMLQLVPLTTQLPTKARSPDQRMLMWGLPFSLNGMATVTATVSLRHQDYHC